jgi:hypothetical protein
MSPRIFATARHSSSGVSDGNSRFPGNLKAFKLSHEQERSLSARCVRPIMPTHSAIPVPATPFQKPNRIHFDPPQPKFIHDQNPEQRQAVKDRCDSVSTLTMEKSRKETECDVSILIELSNAVPGIVNVNCRYIKPWPDSRSEHNSRKYFSVRSEKRDKTPR